MLKPAIATVSLGRSAAGHGIIGKLRQASLAGFSGVEIFFECLESLAGQKQRESGADKRIALIEAARDVRATCDAENLAVMTLQPFVFYDGLLDEATHRQKIKTLHLWFEICHILGTDLIQIPTNFQPDGTTGQLDRLVTDLTLVARLGLQQSPPIRLSYEGICWGTHISTWEGTWEVVKQVNLPNLGLCLDTFHIAGRVWGDPTSPSGRTQDADEALEASLDRLVREVDPRKIFYVQLSDAEHCRL
jgi:4-hydroxyphenylpyruvate dioxygenase